MENMVECSLVSKAADFYQLQKEKCKHTLVSQIERIKSIVTWKPTIRKIVQCNGIISPCVIRDSLKETIV